ncbi:MAG: trimethylamine methyltransferase family protein [Acidimicrobiales bacterium]
MGRRAGGRAARVAIREAPLSQDARAVWPGIEGGKFKPLTDKECGEVFEAALTMLEDIGMGQATPEFIDIVTAAGGHMDEHDRLHFPRDLVRRCMDSAAKEITLHSFNGDDGVELGGNRVHFSTAGAAVLMLDHETERFRHSTVQDVYDTARLGDTLDNIHMFVRMVVARDMELSRDVDINTAYATMIGTSKPQGTSMFEPGHVHEVAAMYDIALGGEGEFRKRPFVMANNTFVVPPLRFAHDSALCMAEQVRVGMPINLLSAGQAGATSPAALAGSLVQALAECLAALTCVNLITPGHPCIMGLWPFVSDLRTGAMSGGSGEEAILNAAAAQVAGSYLGLPVGVAAGMADSKLPDNQAGHEKSLAISLAANAGANIVYESAGMLASLMACSLEAMVIDNDMLGAINRTVRGIEITPDSLSTEAMRDVVYGAGHFLGHEQTLSIMQSEYTYPLVGDRNSPDDWVDAGARNVKDVAHDYVTRTLESHWPDHVPAENDAKIRAAFDNIVVPPRP